MDWKIEVVPMPVADIDRAKAFYADKLGFVVDLDERFTEPDGNGWAVQQMPPQAPAG